ncbi:hypothetical protein GOBAR_AA22615 [Gossypium barbadense]|uniref:Uncharacterized protein n=1 Tax=Gossypium barbadense TaxID=3634 RepID=A0A2P5X3X7_GOSBA|nr:hypothetical protein GOBAR_AA22615 [Gossypium barbadense]
MDGWWLRRWVLMTWRDIISNVLWVLLLGGLDEAVLRREPEVPSQSSHIGPDRDDPSPMSLRLMVDGEGDEVGKVKDVPVGHAPQEIGVVSVDDVGALPPSRQSVGQDGVIIEVGHNRLKMKLRAEFQRELEIHRLDDLKKEPPRRPTPRGRACNIRNSSSWGPKGNSRKGCLISMVGPKDDAAPFLFFDAGTAIFFPREDDMVCAKGRNLGRQKQCCRRRTGVADFGAHGCGARPCALIFARLFCDFQIWVRLTFGLRRCMIDHTPFSLTVSTTGAGHGRVACPCCFGSFAHGLSPRPWQLIASHVGEKNCPVFTQPCLLLLCEHDLRHSRVPGRVDGKNPIFQDSVSRLDVKN